MDDVHPPRGGDGLTGRHRSPNPHGGPIGSGPSVGVAAGRLHNKVQGGVFKPLFSLPISPGLVLVLSERR